MVGGQSSHKQGNLRVAPPFNCSKATERTACPLSISSSIAHLPTPTHKHTHLICFEQQHRRTAPGGGRNQLRHLHHQAAASSRRGLEAGQTGERCGEVCGAERGPELEDERGEVARTVGASDL